MFNLIPDDDAALLDKCLRTVESNTMDQDEALNFYLELLARNCRSFVSLKTNDCDVPEFSGKCIAREGSFDLQYTFLSTEDHCQLIQKCPNLEVRDELGDRGLQTLAQKCKKLRRLRVNMTLRMNKARFDRERKITELPLDNGVRALLRGCTNLQRFSLYLRPRGLSDVGLGYIGECSGNIRYMLLGNVRQSDGELLQFARTRSNLQNLELRCCFSVHALARASLHLHSLRYPWLHEYQSSTNGYGHGITLLEHRVHTFQNGSC